MVRLQALHLRNCQQLHRPSTLLLSVTALKFFRCSCSAHQFNAFRVTVQQCSFSALSRLEACLVQAVLRDSWVDLTMQEEEDEEAGEDDPGMEGELTSADYHKLQSLVDEQEQAVEAG